MDSVLETDILIVGGGIIGLSIARELVRAGRTDIVVIDKGEIGSEASWAAAGMLTPQAETDASGPFLDMCLASRDLYPEFAAQLHDQTGVDIALDRSGTFSLAFSDQDAGRLAERLAFQSALGLPVESVRAEDVRKAEPFISPEVLGALYFPGDWQVDNRKVLDALRYTAAKGGVRVIENSPVASLITDDHGTVVGAATAAGTYTAGLTILTAGAWTSAIRPGIADYAFRVEPVRGEIVMFRSARQVFSHVLYGPNGYIVPRQDGRLLAGSTVEWCGFDGSTTEAGLTRLRQMAVELAPSIAGLPVADHWAGLRPFVRDEMPVIGSISGLDGLLVATGHYRNGILLAPVTAKMVADLLNNEPTFPFYELCSPDRFRLRQVGGSA